MTPDRIDELIALAALGELSVSEQRDLDAAALDDPVVAGELDDALGAAAALQRPHGEAPPERVRNSVLAAIAATPQEQSGPGDVGFAGGADTWVDATVTSLDTERARRRLRPLLSAAAAVAILAVGAVALIATDQPTVDPIAAVVDASDAATRSLTGEIDGFAVTYSESEGALVVEGDGLPVLDDTATYQLWLVGADGATSVGVFRPDADGSVSDRFAGADPTGLVLGVTEEPAGGSAAPTSPILASA